MQSLPMPPADKIDLDALPAPCESDGAPGFGVIAPRDLVEMKLAGAPYQTALIGRRMAGMVDETLVRRIKKDAQLKETPLIMITSLNQRGDKRRLKEI